MRSSGVEPLPAVSFLTPPYQVTAAPTRPSGHLPRGSIVVLDVSLQPAAWSDMSDMVAGVRTRFPAAPVVLRVPELTPETLRLAYRAGRMGIRALVGYGEPLDAVLRPLLTRTDDLADDLAEWLEFHGRSPSPAVAETVRHIVSRAPRYAQLGDLLHGLGTSERTVRHRFRAARGPGARAWHQFARALHGALRLQREPWCQTLEVALDLGYSDHSGLSRQLTRAFGVTPAAIRGTLGWEWLAERWVGRASPAEATLRV